MMRRTSLILAGLAITGLVALTATFPVQAIGDELARHAQTWDLSLETEGSGFGLLRGARLTGVSIGAVSDGLRLEARVSTVLAPHRWAWGLPLTVDRVRLLGADVRLTIGQAAQESSRSAPASPATDVSGPAGTAGSAEAEALDAAGATWLVLDDPSLELDGATLFVHIVGEDGMEMLASGLTATLSGFTRLDADGGLLQAVSFQGGFLADAIELGRLRIRDVAGRLEMADGLTTVVELTFVCGNSELRIPALELDLTSEPLSLTTRDDILERSRSVDGAEWAPLASLTELGPRCL